MKRLKLTILFILTVLFVPLLSPSTAVHAQEAPITIKAVQPNIGFPDTEMEIRIYGSGFEAIEEMEIFIVGIEVWEYDIESPESIRAQIYIPPETPPGPKAVAFSYTLDNTPFRALLRDGFEVLPPDEQPQPFLELYAVEPAEAMPGTQVEVILTGAGFASLGEIAADIEGIEIYDTWIESDGQIGMNIFIPEDARPGRRWVEVVSQDGRNAILAEGFNVLIPNQPLPPPTAAGSTGRRDEPDPPINWLWPVSTLLLMTASYLIGRRLALRSKLTWTDKAKLQWQHEAETKLPEPQRACQWTCKASASSNLLNRWQVKQIELTPLDVKGKTPKRKIVDNKGGALDPLNNLTNITDVLRSQQSAREQIAGVVDVIMAQILAWEGEGQSPASVRLDAQLGGEIEATFGLYHCHQTRKGLSWGKKPLLKWKSKLNQPAGEHLGVLRGPTAGESDFPTRARREIEDCLLDLLEGVRLWL